MKTTLNKIRKHSPCADGWEKLLSYLGKTKADDEPLAITTILDSNGLDDAIWCLQAVAGRDREIRLFAVSCARQVQHVMTDQRSLDALDVAERYANGEATDAELAAARSAAWAARSAAWAATWAAEDAAWDARDAAEAARAAAWAAEAAWAAAWAAEDAAEAARDAAEAARAAVWAACWAAWDAAEAKQEAELRRICGEG